MTLTHAHLHNRASTFRLLWDIYNGMATNALIGEAERACYADVADLLVQIEERISDALFEIDDQKPLPMPLHRQSAPRQMMREGAV